MSSRVKTPVVTFGLVERIAKIIVITLDINIIKVGITKWAFLGLSNFGIIEDNAIEIIIAFTESKILALLSAIPLKRV